MTGVVGEFSFVEVAGIVGVVSTGVDGVDSGLVTTGVLELSGIELTDVEGLLTGVEGVIEGTDKAVVGAVPIGTEGVVSGAVPVGTEGVGVVPGMTGVV